MNSFSSMYWFVVISILGISGLLAESNATVEDDFANNVYLDEDEMVHLLWTKLNDTYLEMEVICENLGWCAIGFSPNGQMPDSDIIFFWVDDETSNVYLQDRWAEGRSVPILDANQDALVLLDGGQMDNYTYVHFLREINPCYELDSIIETGTSRVLYAFNENDPSEVYFEDSNGVDWHGSYNVGYKSVNLLSYSPDFELDYDNLDYYDVRMPNHTVPDYTNTDYYCTLVKLPTHNKTQHIVEIAPLVKEGNEAVVHHALLYHCPSSYVNESNVGLHMNCDEYAGMGIGSSSCADGAPIYSWAIGGESYQLPPHVGIPMSGNITNDKDMQYVVLEIHYDNPKYESGIHDDSGFRIWYTNELRNESASGMWVGINVNPWHHYVPAGLSEVTNTGYCGSECTSYAIPDTGITVFSSMLHAHTHGVAMKATVIRQNGTEVLIEENKNYDFDYQTTTYLENFITIYPGDTITMSCTYDTSNDTSTVYAGEGASEEMCIVWLTFYPEIELTWCTTLFSWSNGYWDYRSEGISLGYFSYVAAYGSEMWTAAGTDEDALEYYDSLWSNTDAGFLEQSCSSTTSNEDLSNVGDNWWDYTVPTNYTPYVAANYCTSGVVQDDGYVSPAPTDSSGGSGMATTMDTSSNDTNTLDVTDAGFGLRLSSVAVAVVLFGVLLIFA